MKNTSEQIVLIGRMQRRLEESVAKGFRDNPKALAIVSEMKDAIEFLEELAHAEFLK